ncbi:rod shape-determining protein MreD [Rubrobacter marinus]|uniref:Rod shape-determining protein MreD n=1 Tax=Rubrobacter marinus TaxID=2653852 RepID=A0A6G8PX50_9ACTN|nr:rod shape-determining protein MreD [Rubrobacter marinus]QIN78792.1 rod shape-determining protein MreD [Rubrobacter marinus]
MVGGASIVRAAVLVGVAAVLEAALSPLLTFGWVGPRFAIIGILVATSGQRDLQALLLGFFGGILTDALAAGTGIFGVGALGGLAAAAISMRASGRKGDSRAILALCTVVAVAVYDLVGLVALSLAGAGGPSFLAYAFGGILPDALLNGVLAYLVGAWLFKIVTKDGGKAA